MSMFGPDVRPVWRCRVTPPRCYSNATVIHPRSLTEPLAPRSGNQDFCLKRDVRLIYWSNAALWCGAGSKLCSSSAIG